MKAIGYIRVSTADQANSLEVQTKKIQDYCKFREIELESIFVDEDVSGGKPFVERKGGAAANEALKGIKIIISVKPDRLFRSVKDALITVDEWSQKDVALHVIDMGGNSIDTQTAMGRMFFIQSISMAEFERRVTGERTKAVLNNKKETGKAYCAGVLGFDNVDGKMVRNEEEFKIIDLIFDLRSRGQNPTKIASTLNLKGLKAKRGGDFFPSTIRAILTNDVYKMEMA